MPEVLRVRNLSTNSFFTDKGDGAFSYTYEFIPVAPGRGLVPCNPNIDYSLVYDNLVKGYVLDPPPFSGNADYDNYISSGAYNNWQEVAILVINNFPNNVFVKTPIATKTGYNLGGLATGPIFLADKINFKKVGNGVYGDVLCYEDGETITVPFPISYNLDATNTTITNKKARVIIETQNVQYVCVGNIKLGFYRQRIPGESYYSYVVKFGGGHWEPVGGYSNINMNRAYIKFENGVAVVYRWYQNIGITYNVTCGHQKGQGSYIAPPIF